MDKLGRDRVQLPKPAVVNDREGGGGSGVGGGHLVKPGEDAAKIAAQYPHLASLRAPALVLQAFWEQRGTLPLGKSIDTQVGRRVPLPDENAAAALDAWIKNQVSGASEAKDAGAIKALREFEAGRG